MIDSISKIFNVLQELHNIQDPYNKEFLKDWEFLKTWEGLSIEDKHKKYNKQSCHELNLFLRFKDPAYFDTFIKNYL